MKIQFQNISSKKTHEKNTSVDKRNFKDGECY